MQFLLDAIAAVPPAALAKYALGGAIIGAVAMPAIMFIGLKFNLKRVRTTFEASRIPQTPRLYRLFAAGGAGMFGIITASQPVLDAAGENEVYIRGALLPVLLLMLWPLVRALRHLSDGG